MTTPRAVPPVADGLPHYVDSDRKELFDLEADPGELVNLAPRRQDRCLEYRRRLGGLVRYQRSFLARHGAR